MASVKINGGFFFVLPLRIFGFCIMLASLGSLGPNWILGIILLVAGVFLGFSIQGVEAEVVKHRYRKYISFLGIRLGEWKSMVPFKDIAILGGRESQTTYSTSNRSTTLTKKYFDICMLNEDHRQRVAIKRCQEMEEAQKQLKYLSEQLDLRATVFNPKISVQTRMRRR